ncbi:50S ribosomal protein L14 [Candidatus Micrarchaeota archaeon]|nr:50S ribosomal protein L14 [Candidatus Micrarchaeota archaeon]MBU1165944.1 50S ribosomal protein L14 [Candidatus Micrarchaeota archaeon]MBU1886848.1 50S ribosomal protein L14 [Candidatus Micrarchaeota archaeon]
MKGITSNIVKTLTVGSFLPCSDNSGAKIVNVIGALRYKGTRGRGPQVGVGDIVIASVRKGKPDLVGKVVKALIVRQKKEFRRPNGTRIMFEDNAVVLVNDDFLPVGTEIKGVVAREIAERFPKVAAISAGVV